MISLLNLELTMKVPMKLLDQFDQMPPEKQAEVMKHLAVKQEQERRDEREQRIRHELEMEQIAKDPSSYRSAIKGSFRALRKSVALGKGSENNRTVKIILFVFILSMLGYMIFFR